MNSTITLATLPPYIVVGPLVMFIGYTAIFVYASTGCQKAFNFGLITLLSGAILFFGTVLVSVFLSR